MWSLCSAVLVECAQGVASFLRIKKNQETVLSSSLLRWLASLEFLVPVSLVDSFPKALSPGLNHAVCEFCSSFQTYTFLVINIWKS